MARRAGRFVILVLTLESALWWPGTTGGQEDVTVPRQSSQPSPSPQFLPHDAGQKWIEYDVRAYTTRWLESDRPERWIVDWILRETGTDVWFGDPLGFLGANRHSIRVYHTPEIHEKVRAIVERYVEPRVQTYRVGVTILTVASPNWRSKAWPLLRSMPTASPGVEAWLVSRENAALLVAELRKRLDTSDYTPTDLAIPHGQTQTIERRQARQYARSIAYRDNAYPPYEIEWGSIDEGFSLQVSPLFSADASYVDVAVRCQIDQVERFLPVAVDVPGGWTAPQRLQLEVPQLVSWRLHERFRWPADHVLLLSCGVVAKPQGDKPSGLSWALSPARGRADALLLLETKTSSADPLAAPPSAPQGTRSADGTISRGRY